MGYALLWEKRWAVDVGIAYCVVGMCTCVFAFVRLLLGGDGALGLELIFLAFFVRKLIAIRPDWQRAPATR